MAAPIPVTLISHYESVPVIPRHNMLVQQPAASLHFNIAATRFQLAQLMIPSCIGVPQRG